ncbi:DUF547 domain-containing protein [Halostagnicola sp. A-GB9-2]|uniref:DUF547 domain-containing protein n=1 Tax=Halostagnicola sp. A-GB9-2 TaxID=3048066 RepID=UPI0024BF89DF|nr:DUF547 domain-containing protein [Halostagnicola sp. A-GB9-2]MDJ1431297.1 DUF547 domain-containing protein [Halostagnicola sp. A-GB9-2]
MPTQLDPLSLSADLLYAVRTADDVDWLKRHLATLERSHLLRSLRGREQRLAFWLNCYNAYLHLLCESSPSIIDGSSLERWKFYARDRIPIAGVWLSLADIEHGMLRGSKHPWGLGYLPRPFPSSFEREFRLESVDPRIHFALGRIGETGPPSTVFSSADIDEELDLTTEWYLEETVVYDAGSNTATVPFLFLWYRGDFGGGSGVLEFLREYDALPETAVPRLEYESMYGEDWSIDIERARDRE